MTIPWDCHGTAVELPLDCHGSCHESCRGTAMGAVMGRPWDYHMGLISHGIMNHHGTAMTVPSIAMLAAMALSWYYHEADTRTPWGFNGTATEPSRHVVAFHGTFAAPHRPSWSQMTRSHGLSPTAPHMAL